MKIILMSVGTRGDMEPFLAIGEILKERGHQIICAFPEQFRNLAEDSNLKFASLGTKFIDLLESDAGKAALGGSGSGLKKMLGYIKLAMKQTEANKELVQKQYELVESENPDRIVYNGKALYSIIWELDNKGKTVFVSPLPYMHYVKGHTHIAFNSNFGTLLNKLTFSLARSGMITTVMIIKKWLKIKKRITRKQIGKILRHNKTIYTISPSLFLRPDNWSENIQVLGYHERNKHINWHPDKTLNDYLKKHNRILFITFGSMTNPEPEKKTQIIMDILQRNKIPAIINTTSGGLIKPDKYDSNLIYCVPQIPYDWIFPRIYGVIHHGGSGTTHLGLKYGCATMIIPHIIDQHIWNKIIYNRGVGPKGLKINKLTTKILEPKILELMNETRFKKKAEQIANQMAKEDFREKLYNTIVM